ncbi:DUF4250 domain-containing protein [Thalassotalea ponticola]|uniref:DUF4250 domain-containing protein n=1 Tax=Thalassotalea ponticola TaxID=1523392 RepID=UPI0025B55AC1|nr:DUF4250 domain-containing protein [Thalassotalea ponticola]MDN3651620.1 DUF4250 domain-containing protein [Thalassotalea ponticola]
MEINQLLSMNGSIVLGIINERLRLECGSIDQLISRYDLDEDQLYDKMSDIGYHYDPLTNQFKPCRQ